MSIPTSSSTPRRSALEIIVGTSVADSTKSPAIIEKILAEEACAPVLDTLDKIAALGHDVNVLVKDLKLIQANLEQLAPLLNEMDLDKQESVRTIKNFIEKQYPALPGILEKREELITNITQEVVNLIPWAQSDKEISPPSLKDGVYENLGAKVQALKGDMEDTLNEARANLLIVHQSGGSIDTLVADVLPDNSINSSTNSL